MAARTTLLLAVALAALLAADPARALETMRLETVAVMPMGAFRSGNATLDATAMMESGLAAQGFATVPRDALEDFLVARRIRRAEFLDRSAIRAMGAALRADAMLTGSVDVFAGRDAVQVSVNVQLVDCVEASVVWANAVSLAGRDFVTVLGLGRVTSPGELLERAVGELLGGIPRQATVEQAAMSPYELVRAGFAPEVLRGGEEAVLSVEARDGAGGLDNVRAFLLDDEIPLVSEDGRWFTGTVEAPVVDGRYGLRLVIRDARDRMVALDDVAVLTVHNTPPEVSMTVRNRIFSPNNDGTLDGAMMIPAVARAANLRGWRLDILGPEGRPVRSEQGGGALPDAFAWRGLDAKGAPVPDGVYSCRLEVVDRAGNVSSTPSQRLVLDREPPAVDCLLADRAGTLVLETRVDDVSGLESWSLDVYAADGSASRRFQGRGPLPGVLPCGSGDDGEDAFASWSLEAVDRAGNRLRTGRSGLERKAPPEPEAEPQKPVEVWLDDF